MKGHSPISGDGWIGVCADGSLRRWRVGCESRSAAGLVGFTVEFTGESSLYQALSLNYYCDFVLERFGFARAGLNL